MNEAYSLYYRICNELWKKRIAFACKSLSNAIIQMHPEPVKICHLSHLGEAEAALHV